MENAVIVLFIWVSKRPGYIYMSKHWCNMLYFSSIKTFTDWLRGDGVADCLPAYTQLPTVSPGVTQRWD